MSSGTQFMGSGMKTLPIMTIIAFGQAQAKFSHSFLCKNRAKG
jgi:hypothetical protein